MLVRRRLNQKHTQGTLLLSFIKQGRHLKSSTPSLILKFMQSDQMALHSQIVQSTSLPPSWHPLRHWVIHQWEKYKQNKTTHNHGRQPITSSSKNQLITAGEFSCLFPSGLLADLWTWLGKRSSGCRGSTHALVWHWVSPEADRWSHVRSWRKAVFQWNGLILY